MYKYFSQSEVNKYQLEPKLWELLDKAREISGVPYLITSGRRTTEHNAAIGGAKNSAHLTGLAVDIACNNSTARAKILWGLMNFYKELFIEICPAHIHVDMCSDHHSLGCVILGDDK